MRWILCQIDRFAGIAPQVVKAFVVVLIVAEIFPVSGADALAARDAGMGKVVFAEKVLAPGRRFPVEEGGQAAALVVVWDG